jgi:hypothetical protein
MDFKLNYDKKSRCTLIIDGNWLLISRLAILKGKFDSVDELFPFLKKNMIKSIALILNQIKSIDNIIFVSDGGSWRKHLNLPTTLLNTTSERNYKGTRDRNDGFDWDKLFKNYNEFIEELYSIAGINVYSAHNIEGDDWCWYLSNALYKDGTNCIILSADKDLTQLVKFNPLTYNFVLTYYKVKSSKHIITYDEKFDEYKDNISISFFLDRTKLENFDCIKECLNISTELRSINPKEVIISKIFIGDVSDNVLPVLYSTSNSKTYKLNKKSIDFNLNFESDEAVKEYVETAIKTNSKYSKFDSQMVTEHALYNRKLVYLSESEYPEEILNTMEKFSYYSCSKDVSKEMAYLDSQMNQVTDFLDSL